jgi:hypothetical protein
VVTSANIADINPAAHFRAHAPIAHMTSIPILPKKAVVICENFVGINQAAHFQAHAPIALIKNMNIVELSKIRALIDQYHLYSPWQIQRLTI